MKSILESRDSQADEGDSNLSRETLLIWTFGYQSSQANWVA
jgi:hypothetical protein